MPGFNSVFSANLYNRQYAPAGNFSSSQCKELNNKINALSQKIKNKNFNVTYTSETPRPATTINFVPASITAKPANVTATQTVPAPQPVTKPAQTAPKPVETESKPRQDKAESSAPPTPSAVRTTSVRSSSTSSCTGLNSAQPRRSLSPVVEKALELAESQVGVKENGFSNDSTQIRKYKNGAVNNKPWCGSFASWLFGAGQNGTNSKTFGYSMHSQEIRRRATEAGFYATKNSGYTPQVGDLMIIKYPSKNGKDGGGHVGIITKVNDNGTFETIEGNYSNSVNRVSRSMATADLHGFVKMNDWLQC